MADENSTVRITTAAIYQKQLEMNETQIKILEKLDHLDDVPDRLRDVEIELARIAWIEKVSYTGLTAGIVAILGGLINLLIK